MINHADMVSVLAKSGDTIASELTGKNAHLLHMAVGISGEAAELLGAFEAEAEGKSLDMENVLEELGDLEFYIEGLRQGLGVTRDKVLNTFPSVLVAPNGDYDYSGWYAVKISTRSGDILDLIKKVVVYQKDVELEKIVKELSSLETVLDAVRDSCDITYEQCLEANIAKLGKRYDGFKYSDSAAQTRADKITVEIPEALLNELGTFYNIVENKVGSDITEQSVSRKTNQLSDGKKYLVRLDEINSRCILRYFEETL